MSNGSIFGLLVFACTVTYVILWLISRFVSVESEESFATVTNGTKTKVRDELILLSGRLNTSIF